MKPALLMIDLDGTLIGESLTISSTDSAAVGLALASGIAVCLATGRLLSASRRFADALCLHDYIAVLQGSQIYDLDSDRLEHAIPLENSVALRAYDALKGRGFHLQLYFGDRLYLDELDERARYYLDMSQVEPEMVADLRSLLDGSPPPGAGPMKVLGVHDAANVSAAIPELERELGRGVSVFRSQPVYLEVVDVRADKAHALLWIAKSKGIPLTRTAAIGDSDNDVSMLRIAGRSFAVGNATRAARAAAQAVVAPLGSNGVAQAVGLLLQDGA